MRGALGLVVVNGLVAIGLMFAIAAQWSQGSGQVAQQATGVGGAQRVLKTAATPSIPTATLEEYDAMVERPLFSPDRRPAPVEVVAEAAQPSLIDKLVLTGIVTGPDKKLAIFVNGADQKELRIAEGGAFEGWRLADFTESGVSFSREGTTRELPLYKEDQGGAATAAGGMQANGAVRRYLTRRQRAQVEQQ